MEFRRVLFRSPAAPALGALAAARAGAADGAADRLRGLRPVAAQPQRAGDLRRSRRALQVRLDPRRDGIRPAVLDLAGAAARVRQAPARPVARLCLAGPDLRGRQRSAEHTSELQSLMRTQYAGLCWKKKTQNKTK